MSDHNMREQTADPIGNRSTQSQPDRRCLQFRDCWWIVAAMVLGAGLRLAAARGEFWLDEIWSWAAAAQLETSAEIVTGFKHDNNHLLNTWILYQLGPRVQDYWYRLPAIIAGLGTILLTVALTKPLGRTTCLLTTCAMASSYLMIHYSSEARGYAYLLFFTVLYVWQADRLRRNPHPLVAAWCTLAVIFGLLSHLTFLFAWAAGSMRSLAQLRSCDPAQRPRFALAIGVANLPPVLLFVPLYLVHYRGMTFGGGESAGLLQVVASHFSLTLGGPASGIPSVLVLAMTISLAVYGISRLSLRDSSWLVFYGVLFFSPFVALAIVNAGFLYVRYFLVWVPFVLLAIAQALSSALHDRTGWRIAAIVFIVAYLGMNGMRVSRLIERGRGHYTEALQLIREDSRQTPITIGSDYDVRHKSVIDFIETRSEVSGRLHYLNRDEWPHDGPEWLLMHSQKAEYHPPTEFITETEITYHLRHVYAYAGLSGWHLAVYQRIATPNDSESRNQ